MLEEDTHAAGCSVGVTIGAQFGVGDHVSVGLGAHRVGDDTQVDVSQIGAHARGGCVKRN